MRVADKLAFVTGGTGGIGAATARMLAREGAKVVITDLDERAGRELAAEIGGDFHHLDVVDPSAWGDVVGQVISDHGRIDVLVQCAGIEGDLKTDVLDISPELWKKVIDVNLNGSFYGAKTVMPHMLAKKSGSVIMVSSIVAYMSAVSAAPYGVSKAGVQHLTKTLALAGARDGARVRVNSIHPGLIKSRMTDDIIQSLANVSGATTNDIEQMMYASVPFGDRGTPDDVAFLVLYLASDEAKYMTGSDIKIDGGWLIKDATG